MNLTFRFFAAVLVAASLTAGAASACDIAAQRTQPTYMVSALLQLPGAEAVVKLVHALEPALSPEEATTRVLRQIAKDFPRYVVASTLATPVADKALSCAKPATVFPVAREYGV